MIYKSFSRVSIGAKYLKSTTWACKQHKVSSFSVLGIQVLETSVEEQNVFNFL